MNGTKSRRKFAPCAHLIVAAAETKELRGHSVHLSLQVLLTNALVGRQLELSLAQAVVMGLPHGKRPARKLDQIRSAQEDR